MTADTCGGGQSNVRGELRADWGTPTHPKCDRRVPRECLCVLGPRARVLRGEEARCEHGRGEGLARDAPEVQPQDDDVAGSEAAAEGSCGRERLGGTGRQNDSAWQGKRWGESVRAKKADGLVQREAHRRG